MKQHEDYISGPHKYWIHFFAGLALGGLLGYWWFDGLFGSTVIDLLAIAITGIAFAAFCGRWGEPGWRRISDWLSWWFGTLWVSLLLTVLWSGCSTVDSTNTSARPWNAPTQWEQSQGWWDIGPVQR